MLDVWGYKRSPEVCVQQAAKIATGANQPL